MRLQVMASLAVTVLLSSAAAQADVEISSKPTANMSCNAGVCTATAQVAVLNVGDLQTMLASGDVTVKTGSIARDIDIDQPLTWSSTSRLTLDAQHSVTVRKAVTVTGAGALTVTTNDGRRTGKFSIKSLGSIQFWDLSSSLVIDGNSYVLVADIKTLAANIAGNPSGFFALAKPYDASLDGVYSSSPVPTVLTGTFDGLGNAISNLTIRSHTRYGYSGLFIQIGDYGKSGGTVMHLRIVKARVHGGGKTSIVGVLAAENAGTLFEDTVSGSVAGQYFIGGIAGINVGGGIIMYSSSTAAVSGLTSEYGGNAGGIAGDNEGTIVNSRASGAITNAANDPFGSTGGLAGLNIGVIASSFATGRVVVEATRRTVVLSAAKPG